MRERNVRSGGDLLCHKVEGTFVPRASLPAPLLHSVCGRIFA
ncbi:hypothetical protein ASZ90_009986 [hydrocarbon metagenome]|uniref:Uncharacterized protein n=1 Tax=hydrocarbon metagenome TaxID=938273 RepID=A0A0W8FH74_9ZZZZ